MDTRVSEKKIGRKILKNLFLVNDFYNRPIYSSTLSIFLGFTLISAMLVVPWNETFEER